MKKSFTLFILLSTFFGGWSGVFAQTITMQGNAFKIGETDHSGVKVILKRTTPSAYNDTIITDASGYYTKVVPFGIYNIKFYHDSFPFPTDYQYQRSCYSNQTLNNVNLYPVNCIVPAGNYYPGVTATVGLNDSLTLLPGTIFYFYDNANLNITGNFTSIGHFSDSISFLSYPGTTTSSQLYWVSATKMATLKYCKFNGCNAQVYTGSSTFRIYMYNCVFNGTSAFNTQWTGGLLEMSDCNFVNNTQIKLNGYYNRHSIRNSEFNYLFFQTSASYISAPLYVMENCSINILSIMTSLSLTNSTVSQSINTNLNDAIYCYRCNFNNISITNANGTSSFDNCNFNACTLTTHAIFKECSISSSIISGSWLNSASNSIFYNNTGQAIIRNGGTCTSSCFFSNDNDYSGIDSSFGDFVGINLNGDSIDIYGNIFADPLFVDTANNDCHLSIGSPCIDAGDNSLVIDSIDLDGNWRVSDGDGDGQYIVDIGAYEYYGTTLNYFTTECHDLNDNMVPQGWVFEEALATANISGGQMNALITDAEGRLSREGTMPNNTSKVVLEWDGDNLSSTWGRSTHVKFILQNGNRLWLSNFTSGVDGPDSYVNILLANSSDTYIDTLVLKAPFSFVAAQYHYKVSLSSDSVGFCATNISNQTNLFNYNLSLVNEGIFFPLDSVIKITFLVGATTDNSNWLDNPCITIYENNCTDVALTIDTTVCSGGTVTIGSNTYDSTGTYVDTLLTSLGCDSIITTNLTVVQLADIGDTLSLSIPVNGLVGYWPFNGNANDESGNGNDGTINGGVQFENGIIGQTGKFRASQGDYITVNNSPSIQNITDFTISVWVKPIEFDLGAWNCSEMIVGKGWGDVSLNRYAMIIERNYTNMSDCSTPTFDSLRFYDHSGDAVPLYTPYVLPNHWYHFVATIENNIRKSFINGNLVNSDTITPTSFINSNPLYINHHTWCGGGCSSSRFGGNIDEVRVYNRALTPSEIQALYLEGSPLSVSVSNDTICSGTSATIQISNAQPGISYQLLANNSPYGSPQVGNADTLNFNITSLSGLIPFTISATDTASSCNIVLDTVLNVFFAPAVTVNLGPDRNICAGQSVTLDAGIHQQYHWSTGAVTRWINVSPTVTTLYSVTVTDNGCTASDAVIINVSGANCISLAVTTTPTTCADTTGTATVSVTGGTLPYTYQWTSGDTTATALNLGAGIYIVTVTDANGNYAYTQANVSGSSGPAVVPTVTNVLCAGGSNGGIQLTVSGGTPAYTFEWSTGQATQNISGLHAGTFDVEVEDAAGCIVVLSVEVQQPGAINIIPTITPATCGGSDGEASISITGGTSPYGILWSNGITTANNTGLQAGSYTVIVTDNNGCIGNTQVSIVVNNINAPVVTLDSLFNANCGSGDGSAYVSISGGNPPYTILWTGGSSDEDLVNVAPGVYDIAVEDTSGCVGLLSVYIESALPVQQPVCIVTVDSIVMRNMVVWEKQQSSGISHYKIYREGSVPNQYYPVGMVNYDDMSEYTDMAANPRVRSFRYKISAVDACGTETPLSALHKTIHLTINQGLNQSFNLIWDDYEGVPFYTYYIHRYTNANGWEILDSLPCTLHSYTDFPLSLGGLKYLVSINVPSACYPTSSVKAVGGPYGSSYSNMEDNLMDPVSVSEVLLQGNILVFPNPMTTSVTLQIPKSEIRNSKSEAQNPKSEIRILDVTGKVIRSEPLTPDRHAELVSASPHALITIDRGDLKSGIYFIEINTGTVYRAKLVVE